MRTVKRTLFTSLGAGLFLGMASCGGGGNVSGPPPPPPPPPACSVYVLGNFLYPEIFQFSETGTGAATPTATITWAVNDYFTALATDSKGNIYVGDAASDNSMEILIYPPGSNGSPNPATTIYTPLHSGGIMALEVDRAGNVYASLPLLGIDVFSPTANGHYAQSREIAGSATAIVYPLQMAIDAANHVYVANSTHNNGQDAVLIFDPAASGNVAPTGTISGSKTMIGSILGVALDSAGNIYVAEASQASNILEFAAGATGNVAPIRVISSSALNASRMAGGLRVDTSGNIYVLMMDKILKFAPGASGNASPVSEIDQSPKVLNETNWTQIAVH